MTKQTTYKWMWAFAIFIIIFMIATIGIVWASTLNANSVLPELIDIVIIERSELTNLKAHVNAINNFMTFRNNIYILTPNQPDGNAAEDMGVNNVFYCNFTESGTTYQNKLDSYFLEMPNIKNKDNEVPDIQTHAIFLGDQTYPMFKIEKSFLYFGERPRMFNVFRDQAEINFFNGLTVAADDITTFNYTTPSLVSNIELFTDAPAVSTVKDFISLEITEERATLRHDINRDILLRGVSGVDYSDNYTMQFTTLDDNPPYFATFHISGATSSTERIQAVTALKTYLTTKFLEV